MLLPNALFMVGLPGLTLVATVLAIAVGRPIYPGEWEALGLSALVVIFVNAYVLWQYRGHAIRWDDEAIYIRHPHTIFGRPGRTSFARIPYALIERIVKFAPATRIPRRLASVEILVKSNHNTVERPLVIETNLFRRTSLITFLDNLRKRAPQLTMEDKGRDLNSLMQDLIRFTQTP